MESTISTFTSRHWHKLGPASKADIVQAVFVLKRDKAASDKIEKELLARSVPSSPLYTQWLSHEEVVDLMSVPIERITTVTNFLAANGILEENIRVSEMKDKIFVKMPASVAAELLDTDFARFRSRDDERVVLLRVTRPYSLPSDIAEVVSLVDDIVRFPSIRRLEILQSTEGNGADATDPFNACGTKCAGYTTPAVLQQAYQFSPVTKAATGNSAAVAEFQNQYYDTADLTSFSSACGVTATVDTFYSLQGGANNPNICNIGCTEALLDVEYIGVHPIPLTFWYSSSYSLLDWVDNLIGQTNPPLVNSVSYGNDEVQQTSAAYMESCNTQFQAAGLKGLSLLFASGDQGVWGRTGVGATFNPDFPAASPYITAVGGTNFQTKSVIGAESAWNCGGGGFSNEFATPSWQQTFVTNYFSTAGSALPAAALYNAKGRGYPDVAALGGQTNPYCVALRGGSSFGGVAGTSASCPVVAGLITQLNNVRLNAGKTSLGWLNPTIYSTWQAAGCFHDVNDGSMNNCNAGTTGFVTVKGWDAATGFGSLNYTCLAALV